MLAVEEIEANVAGIKATLQQLLAASDLHASNLRPAVFLNNLVLAHCSMPVVLLHCPCSCSFSLPHSAKSNLACEANKAAQHWAEGGTYAESTIAAIRPMLDHAGARLHTLPA